jgi:HrpA-like RNA helicase
MVLSCQRQSKCILRKKIILIILNFFNIFFFFCVLPVKQRAGRAGRVQPGVCLKLYSTKTEDNIMKANSDPELRRIPLEEVCLTILASGLTQSCTEFLTQAPQPPTQDTIQSALEVLSYIGATKLVEPKYPTPSHQKLEVLTPLGQQLATLPVDARVGKMLIYGTLFCCIDAVVTIAAFLSASKSPFALSSSFDSHSSTAAKASYALFSHPTSDFMTFVNVWNSFSNAKQYGGNYERNYCKERYLNYSALLEIRDARMHYVDLLCDIGYLNRKLIFGSENDKGRCSNEERLATCSYTVNSTNDDVVHAVVLAGLYPNVAFVKKKSLSSSEAIIYERNVRLSIRDSINSKLPVIDHLPSSWLVYYDKLGTERGISISTTAFVSPLCLLLFSSSINIDHPQRKVFIDDWIEFTVAAKTAVMFKEIRNNLNSMFESIFVKSHGRKLAQNSLSTKTQTFFNEDATAAIKLVANLLCQR